MQRITSGFTRKTMKKRLIKGVRSPWITLDHLGSPPGSPLLYWGRRRKNTEPRIPLDTLGQRTRRSCEIQVTFAPVWYRLVRNIAWNYIYPQNGKNHVLSL